MRRQHRFGKIVRGDSAGEAHADNDPVDAFRKTGGRDAGLQRMKGKVFGAEDGKKAQGLKAGQCRGKYVLHRFFEIGAFLFHPFRCRNVGKPPGPLDPLDRGDRRERVK